MIIVGGHWDIKLYRQINSLWRTYEYAVSFDKINEKASLENKQLY